MTKTSGTREWCSSNVNFISGCSHDCKYCYAKRMALRFNRIENDADWKDMHLNPKKFEKGYAKRKGRIMFPSSHDLTPEFLKETLFVLNRLLSAGNDVLITTKPHLSVITAICKTFKRFQNQIQFRFTIGSAKTNILQYWEPGAPLYEERRESLKYAFEQGYKTSLSMEPLLTVRPEDIIIDLHHFVTESIWIGTMSGIPADTPAEYTDLIKMTRSKSFLEKIYFQLRDHPLIMWKDSVRQKLKIGIDFI